MALAPLVYTLGNRVMRFDPQDPIWPRAAFGDSWRRSLHLVVARQLLEIAQCMRQRVWEAAHVQLRAVTLDTDTTVQTVSARHKMGARKGYNPSNGERSYADPNVPGGDAGVPQQRVAQVRVCHRPKDRRASGPRLCRTAEGIQRWYARADSRLCCWDTVAAYEGNYFLDCTHAQAPLQILWDVVQPQPRAWCLPTKKQEPEKQSLEAAGVQRLSPTVPRSKI